MSIDKTSGASAINKACPAVYFSCDAGFMGHPVIYLLFYLLVSMGQIVTS